MQTTYSKKIQEIFVDEGPQQVGPPLVDSQEERKYKPDKRELSLCLTEKESVIASYESRMYSFRKETSADKRRDTLLSFIKGESNTIPLAPENNYDEYKNICDMLKPIDEWTFVDRRILACITRESDWYRPEDEFHRGFYGAFFDWVGRELAAESKKTRKDTFDKILAELHKAGIREQKQIIRFCIVETNEYILDEDGNTGSLGRYLLSGYEDYIDFMLDITRDKITRAPLVGLFAKYKTESFQTKLEELLFSSDYAPDNELTYLLKIDPIKFEPYLAKALTLKGSQTALMKSFELGLKYFGETYYTRALQEAKNTIRFIQSKKEKNTRYNFPWLDRYIDGSAEFIQYCLNVFQDDIYPDVLRFIQDCRITTPGIAQTAAVAIGQKGIALIIETLKGKDDETLRRFTQIFSLLKEFDYSNHRDEIWEITLHNSLEVKKLAAQTLSRLGDIVLDKTRDWLASKDKKERLAAVLVSSHFQENQEITELLIKLQDVETDKTIRQELFNAIPLRLDDLVKEIEALASEGKLKKTVKNWFCPKESPGIFWKKGRREKAGVQAEILCALFYFQIDVKEVELDKRASVILKHVDKTKSAPFALALYKLIMKNGGLCVKNRFAIAILGALAGPETIKILTTAAIKERNLNALKAVGLRGSDEALGALAHIIHKYKTKYPNIRSTAQKCFEAGAKARGISPDELLDRLIPDFGFGGRSKVFTFDDTEYKVYIESDYKLRFINGSGKILKSVPTAASAPDKTMLRTLQKDIATARNQQSENLEINMLKGRRWNQDVWQTIFLENPLMFLLGRSLIWGLYQNNEPVESFIITKDSAFENAKGEIIQLQNAARIGLLHPLELSPERIKKWKDRLKEENQRQPFEQLERPVYEPAPESRENTASRLFENKDIVNFAFGQLGWRQETTPETSDVSVFQRIFPDSKIKAMIEVEGFVSGNYVGKLKKFYFFPVTTINTQKGERPIPCGQIPRVIYSEVVRDLSIISPEQTHHIQ